MSDTLLRNFMNLIVQIYKNKLTVNYWKLHNNYFLSGKKKKHAKYTIEKSILCVILCRHLQRTKFFYILFIKHETVIVRPRQH